VAKLTDEQHKKCIINLQLFYAFVPQTSAQQLIDNNHPGRIVYSLAQKQSL
jgi:hypothetical protein